MAIPVDPGNTRRRIGTLASIGASWAAGVHCQPPRRPIAAAIEPYAPSLGEPPYNMQVGNGTWGVEFDESRDVVLSGIRSVHFRNVATAADPYIENKQPVEVNEGDYYTGEVVWRADSILAGNTMKAEIRWLDINWADVSQGAIHDAVLGAANTWENRRAKLQAPTNARFARVRVSKNNTSFNGYLDAFDLLVASPSLRARRIANLTVPTLTPTTVPYDTILAQKGITYDSTTGIITVNIAGLYSIEGSVVIDAMANGTKTSLTFVVNLTNYGTPNSAYNWGGESLETSITMTKIISCEVGDTIKVQIYHNHGSDRTLTDGYLTAFLVE